MHNVVLVYFVNLYMFRAYLRPSSGCTTVCTQQLVLIILFRWLSAFVVGLEFNSSPTTTTDSHAKEQQVLTVVYIRLYLMMMDLDTPETCRVWRNILRISCASSWFFFTRLLMMPSCRYQITIEMFLTACFHCVTNINPPPLAFIQHFVWGPVLAELPVFTGPNCSKKFILFIVILQYIIRQHNNNRVNVYCKMFRHRRVIIRLII